MTLLTTLRPAALTGDTTPPTVETTISRSKISRMTGFDATTVTLTPNENIQGYQIRIVPATTSTVGTGTLVEQGTVNVSGGVAFQTQVTDDEAVAAGALEGNNVLKVFVQDTAGNWSDPDGANPNPPPTPPAVTATAPTNVTQTGATLNGTVNPNGLAVTDYHFEYRIGTGAWTSTATRTMAAGVQTTAVSEPITGLTAGTTYEVVLKATTSAGTTTSSSTTFATSAASGGSGAYLRPTSVISIGSDWFVDVLPASTAIGENVTQPTAPSTASGYMSMTSNDTYDMFASANLGLSDPAAGKTATSMKIWVYGRATPGVSLAAYALLNGSTTAGWGNVPLTDQNSWQSVTITRNFTNAELNALSLDLSGSAPMGFGENLTVYAAYIELDPANVVVDPPTPTGPTRLFLSGDLTTGGWSPVPSWSRMDNTAVDPVAPTTYVGGISRGVSTFSIADPPAGVSAPNGVRMHYWTASTVVNGALFVVKDASGASMFSANVTGPSPGGAWYTNTVTYPVSEATLQGLTLETTLARIPAGDTVQWGGFYLEIL